MEEGLEINELMFVPINTTSICWRMNIKNISDKPVEFKLIANPVFNLELKIKQTGEVWRERKHIVIYDPAKKIAIARHYKYSGWAAVFGSGLIPEIVCFDASSPEDCLSSPGIPHPLKNCHGSSILSIQDHTYAAPRHTR